MPALKKHIKTAFCMTAEVEKSTTTASGYRCAEIQYTTLGKLDLKLFGEERFRGIAAMTRLGYAERVVIIGGREDRYLDENVSRSLAFKAILEHDFGAVGEIVGHVQSGTTMSADAYEVVRQAIGGDDPANYAVVSSKYHCKRIEDQMEEKGLLGVPRRAAEVFSLIEDSSYEHVLLQRFGGGDYAHREVMELMGIAAVLTGTYQSLPVPKG